jgi:hypothetical protein
VKARGPPAESARRVSPGLNRKLGYLINLIFGKFIENRNQIQLGHATPHFKALEELCEGKIKAPSHDP